MKISMKMRFISLLRKVLGINEAMRFVKLPCALMVILLLPVEVLALDPSGIERQLDRCLQERGDCIEKLESDAIGSAKGQVKRNGGVITIRAREKEVSFADIRPDNEEGTKLHFYLGLLETIDHHLIKRYFYEGWDFLLVSPITGEIVEASAIPHPSRSGAFAVTVSAADAFNRNEIIVFKVTPERLIQQFQYTTAGHNATEQSQYTLRYWEGDEKVNLSKRMSLMCPGAHFLVQGIETLQLVDGGWRLSRNSDAIACVKK